MSKKEKRKWGDRKDAYLVRDADPLHNIMNNLMGTRTENEAVVRFEIELSNLKTYLENKNKDCTDKRFRYTFFHAVLAAFARTLDERKRLNYFVRKKKFYMRREISFSYIAKKYKADGAEECVVIQRYKPESEISAIQQIHDKTCKEVNELRETQSKGTDTDKIIKTVLKLPSFVISSFFVLLRALDRCGRVPMFFHKLIPYYSTIFCANLGSIKLNSEYHHLINFGTNSIFAVIGEITRKPELNPDGSFCGFKEYIPITFTVDERIADGVYYANSIDMIKKLLAKPELLDLPANQKLNLEKIYN